MKPVAVFRHFHTEGPGYFATFLERHGIPWQLLRIDAGDAVPASAREFSGLCFMGGPMSVNDDLPWIGQVLKLIRDAVETDVPVIGHCLGGQLMAKALGAPVARNPVKEIGWFDLSVRSSETARQWLGDATGFPSFHWHGETFDIPAGAVHLAESAACLNQMFALGPHLGMQCHVEMTPELVEAWCRDWHREVQNLSLRLPSVQSPEEMLKDLPVRISQLHETAERIYAHWIRNLAR
jgi:GMP synthase-like glutamine amidotransferase